MHTKFSNTFLRTACVAALLAVAGSVAADEGGELADMVSDDLAFAVAVPDGFRLENGDATLAIHYEAGATKLNETISLNISRSDIFAKTVDAEGEVYVGKLGDAGKRQFEQFQNAVARSEATGVEGNGGISVSVNGGCFAGEPMSKLPISSWVQIDASSGFVAIIQNRDLFSLLDKPTRQRLIANLRNC